jgi:hypothetical protein
MHRLPFSFNDKSKKQPTGSYASGRAKHSNPFDSTSEPSKCGLFSNCKPIPPPSELHKNINTSASKKNQLGEPLPPL